MNRLITFEETYYLKNVLFIKYKKETQVRSGNGTLIAM